jgi:dienelactone hydrolase
VSWCAALGAHGGVAKALVLGRARAAFAAAAASEAAGGARRVVAAGFSAGARVALRVAGDAREGAAVSAVACFAFPLHKAAAAKADRADEIEAFAVAARGRPCLFVSGSDDEYLSGGGAERLRRLAEALPPPSRVVFVAGAGHGLARTEAERATVAKHLAAFLRDVDALAAPLGAESSERRGGGGGGAGGVGGARAAGAASDASAAGDSAPVAVGRKRAR